MKIHAITLTMMTLMLSSFPLMAMDSEFQEKRHKALHEESISSTLQPKRSAEQPRKRDVSQRGDGQHRHADKDWQEWDQTREALRYWWR